MAENKKVKAIITKLLKLLEIDEGFEIEETEEAYEVVLNTNDAALVIGHHGDTLESLQLVMSLCISKELGEFKRVSLEVGDYKKNRSEYLTNLAKETKERAVSENKEIYLPDLKSWERRVVHLRRGFNLSRN